MSIILIQGTKYTIIYINEGDMPVLTEVTVMNYFPDQKVYSLKEKGKKGIFYFGESLLAKSIVFKGHALPIILQLDTDDFICDGAFRFLTNDPISLRQFIEVDNINKSHSCMGNMYHQPLETAGDMELASPLFPEYQ